MSNRVSIVSNKKTKNPKTKNNRFMIIMISSACVIVFLAAILTILFIPLKFTTLDSNLKKMVSEEFISVSVQSSPCYGMLEGPRKTYVDSSSEFAENLKTALTQTKAVRDVGLRSGGMNFNIIVETTERTYEMNFIQGAMKTSMGKYRIDDWSKWNFLFNYPDSVFIEYTY